MALGIVRVWVALTLMASGRLLYAASYERWAGACPWGGDHETPACYERMDHLYGVLPPGEPGGPGTQLAGWSLLLLALALPLLPWALTGRRPGRWSAVALVVGELAVVAMGVAALSSSLEGVVDEPVAARLIMWVWVLVPPFLYGRLAVLARGWARVAAVLLVLASPLVAAFTYAVGPFDAQPWWEAVSGVLIGAAGVLVLLAAVRLPARRRAVEDAPALVV